MAEHATLDRVIGVQVPAPQPYKKSRASARLSRARLFLRVLLDFGWSKCHAERSEASRFRPN